MPLREQFLPRSGPSNKNPPCFKGVAGDCERLMAAEKRVGDRT